MNYKDYKCLICTLFMFTLLMSATTVDARERYDGHRDFGYRNRTWQHRPVNVNHNYYHVNNLNRGRYYHNGQHYNYYHNGNYYRYNNNGRYYNYYNNGSYFKYYIKGAYYNNCRKVAGYWSRGQWYAPTMICN